MSFSHDRRGQSVVVGTVILFGFLILALSIYQVQFVPAENSEIEFEHSQEVEGDFQDLRNALLSGGTTGEARSTSIRLGTRYPQRTFFLNPPPASGSLETTAEENLTISDARVGDGVHENVEKFWNDTGFNFDTRSIRYTPNYNEYRGAPELVYENSLVVAEFGDRALPRSDQTIVRDERLLLTVLSGELSESGVEARSVDSETVSRGSNRIPITGVNGENLTISLPTAVDNATDLTSRLDVPAESVEPEDDQIDITLNGSQTYRLALGEVSVDGSGEIEPAYIVPVGGQNVTSGQSVGVEVRDKYNNPVSGTTVSFDTTSDRTTDDDGRVFAEITEDTEAFINGSDPNDPEFESVEFRTTGREGDGEFSRTFSTEWDSADDIADSNSGVGSDNGGLVVNANSDSFDVSGSVTAGGDPVSGLIVGFGSSDSSVLDIISGPDDRTNANGRIEGKSVSVGETGHSRLFISAGDDTDVIPVEVDSGPFFTVEITETNSPIEETDTLDVTVDIENIGTEEGTQSLDLIIDGEIRDTTDEFELEPGETDQQTLSWTTEEGDAGEYTATVESDDDSDQVDVTVVEEDQPAGNVDLQDEISEMDDEFDVTTSDYLNTDEPFLVVENTRTGEEETRQADSEQTFTISATDVGGLEAEDQITATLYEDESEENILDNDTTTITETIYRILSVDPSPAGGNDIDVEFEIDTSDPNAQVNVQSLTADGSVRDETGLIPVESTQPQTETIGGANQATEIRVILFDSDGNEEDRETVPYP